ncbi:hypothetical protein AAC387_Pa12g2351 [Persea americana]
MATGWVRRKDDREENVQGVLVRKWAPQMEILVHEGLLFEPLRVEFSGGELETWHAGDRVSVGRRAVHQIEGVGGGGGCV